VSDAAVAKDPTDGRALAYSLVDLQAAVDRYLADYNASAEAFIWTVDPDTMVAGQAAGTKRWCRSTRAANGKIFHVGPSAD
jgi:hypothetical protein